MKVLLCGGKKTANIEYSIKPKFETSGDTFKVVTFIENIYDEVFARGDSFDRAVIFEQGITRDFADREEYTLRDKLAAYTNMLGNLGTTGRKINTVFVTTDSDLAALIQEETSVISGRTAVLLTGKGYTVSFMCRLITTDVTKFPEEVLYKPVVDVEAPDLDEGGLDMESMDTYGDPNYVPEEMGEDEDPILGAVPYVDEEQEDFEEGFDNAEEYTEDSNESFGEDEYGSEEYSDDSYNSDEGEDTYDEPLDNVNGDEETMNMTAGFNDYSADEYGDEPEPEDEYSDGQDEDEYGADDEDEYNQNVDDEYENDSEYDSEDEQEPEPEPEPEPKKAKKKAKAKADDGPAISGKLSADKLRKALQPFAARGNSIVVTGCGGCGTSTVAYGLASMVWQLGYTVLLVDMDTKHKTQSYISKQNFDSMDPDGSNLMSAINSSTGINTHVAIVGSGFHLLTMGMGSDAVNVKDIVQRDKLSRFINMSKNEHNFVIYDVPYEDAVDSLKEVSYAADNLVIVIDSSNWGISKALLSICNTDDDDMQEVIFNRAQLVFNRDRNLHKLFGKKVGNTQDIVKAMDAKVYELTGDDPELYFKDMHIAGLIEDDRDFENGWYTENQYAETKKGQQIFGKLLESIVLKD